MTYRFEITDHFAFDFDSDNGLRYSAIIFDDRNEVVTMEGFDSRRQAREWAERTLARWNKA